MPGIRSGRLEIPEAEYEYIAIWLAGYSKSGKTRVWRVGSKGDDYLGTVKWFGRWRAYTFYPEPDTVFSEGCLNDIASFLRGATRSQRQASARTYVERL